MLTDAELDVPDRSTIYEVARRSGVSTATVSRVMADGKGFSAATRERVLATAAELGWVPSGPARGLASRRAGVVGLLFPDLGQSMETEEESPLYVDQVIRGAERAATSVGDAVMIAATRTASGRELAFSVAGKTDGLVVMARSLSEHDIAVLSRSVPVVVLANHYVRGGPDFIGADNRSGCREITTHLIRVHGHADLVFLAGPAGSPDSDDRFAGFCEALRQAGLPAPDSPTVSGGFTEGGGRQATAALLGGGRRPQALVCGNDEMAIGALTALRAKKLRVPADITVTGFDDIVAAHHVRPALTTVRQPMRELGEQAVRMLLTRIADADAPRQSVVLPIEVVIRRSCGCRIWTYHGPGPAPAGLATGIPRVLGETRWGLGTSRTRRVPTGSGASGGGSLGGCRAAAAVGTDDRLGAPEQPAAAGPYRRPGHRRRAARGAAAANWKWGPGEGTMPPYAARTKAVEAERDDRPTRNARGRSHPGAYGAGTRRDRGG